jgi:hypothetical protein
MRNKPGYLQSERLRLSEESWLSKMRARYYHKLKDPAKADKYKKLAIFAMQQAKKFRTGSSRFKADQQTRRQRLLYNFSVDLHANDQERQVGDLFTLPDIENVPLSEEALNEMDDFDPVLSTLIRAAEPLGGSGPMTRQPVNIQPLDSSYLGRSFLVAARWLTVSRYLCIATGRPEAQPAKIPAFERIGTGMDLVFELECMNCEEVYDKMRSDGADPRSLTTEQFLSMFGLN